MIKASNSHERLTITKAMMINSINGSSEIGY